MVRALIALLLLTPALVGCLGGGDDPLDPSATHDASGFTDTDVFPGAYDTSGPYSRTLQAGEFEAMEPTIHRLESTLDGATIHLAVRRPDVPDGQQVPVVVIGSPYFANGFDWESQRIARFADNLIPHGYAMALVAVRGTADSGGCSDMFGPREVHDLDQAVTWLGQADWSNGNVGMVGRSMSGTTPWAVASTGNPHLRTIVPVAGAPDLFTLLWRNGTVKAFHSAYLVPAFYSSYGFLTYNPTTGRSVENTAEAVVCRSAFEGTVASAVSSATGEPDPLGYWAERDLRAGVLANYNGSVLLVHGLQDWNLLPSQFHPFTTHLRAHDHAVKHLIGQWGHAWPDEAPPRNPTPRWDWAELLLHWFDRWLKQDPAVDIGPAVQVQDDLLRWRSEDAWPPTDATTTTYHLTADGSLAVEPSGERASMTIAPALPIPDAKHLAQGNTNSTLEVWTHPADRACPACATFTTEPFEQPMHIAGAPRVHVTVTPHGPGGQLTAELFREDETGERKRIGWGSMDLRFAAGGREASEVIPGQTLVARLQLEPMDAAVPEGHRLILVLHEGPWGDNYLPAKTPFPMDIEAGGEQSTLVLETFERAESAYFIPPGLAP